MYNNNIYITEQHWKNWKFGHINSPGILITEGKQNKNFGKGETFEKTFFFRHFRKSLKKNRCFGNSKKFGIFEFKWESFAGI